MPAQNPDIQNKLDRYHALLLEWQKTINLISPNTVQSAWERHFEDSLQLVDHIPKDIKSLADIGSGAGFPGLVIAMARPDLAVHLIESDQKKCAFLKHVSRETGTPVTVHTSRIEQIGNALQPDMVTARALASLDHLFEYCADWIREKPHITLLFPKGAKGEEELDMLYTKWAFDHKTIQSKTDENSKIYLFSNIYRK